MSEEEKRTGRNLVADWGKHCVAKGVEADGLAFQVGDKDDQPYPENDSSQGKKVDHDDFFFLFHLFLKAKQALRNCQCKKKGKKASFLPRYDGARSMRLEGTLALPQRVKAARFRPRSSSLSVGNRARSAFID